MLKKICVFIFILTSAFAADAPVKEKEVVTKNDHEILPEPIAVPYSPPEENAEDKENVISISLSDPKDINWNAYLDTNNNLTPLEPINLPFLQSHPISNLELKLRLLNRKF